MQLLHDHIQKLTEDLQQFMESARRYDPPESSVRSYQHRARQVLDSAQSEYEIWSNASELASHAPNQDSQHKVHIWQDAVYDDAFPTIRTAHPANRDTLQLDEEENRPIRSLSSVSTTSDHGQWDTFRQGSGVDNLISTRLMRPSSICEEIFKRAEMWYAKGDYPKAARMVGPVSSRR
jgi:hypothetical protein